MRDKVPARSPASRMAVTRRHGEKGYEKKERGQTLWKIRTIARVVVGGQ
jgi:hypothetical protein